MKRTERASKAKETVSICDTGFYLAPSGARIAIAEFVAHATAGTVLYSPEKPPVKSPASGGVATRFETTNETTFQALSRLAATGASHIGCLNFASAKNPGGGFLNGSLAQEEALACASALYPCLLRAPDYYERNRANASALYLDLAIFSPLVPFFRDDTGALLEKPVRASVISAPAPNAGAIALNKPGNLREIETAMRRRTELILDIARAHEVHQLILGAWGCGVFRNDPKMVAGIFAELLQPPGRFANVFADVVFAVFDRSTSLLTYKAFADRFGERGAAKGKG